MPYEVCYINKLELELELELEPVDVIIVLIVIETVHEIGVQPVALDVSFRDQVNSWTCMGCGSVFGHSSPHLNVEVVVLCDVPQVTHKSRTAG